MSARTFDPSETPRAHLNNALQLLATSGFHTDTLYKTVTFRSTDLNAIRARIHAALAHLPEASTP